MGKMALIIQEKAQDWKWLDVISSKNGFAIGHLLLIVFANYLQANTSRAKIIKCWSSFCKVSRNKVNIHESIFFFLEELSYLRSENLRSLLIFLTLTILVDILIFLC